MIPCTATSNLTACCSRRAMLLGAVGGLVITLIFGAIVANHHGGHPAAQTERGIR